MDGVHIISENTYFDITTMFYIFAIGSLLSFIVTFLDAWWVEVSTWNEINDGPLNEKNHMW